LRFKTGIIHIILLLFIGLVQAQNIYTDEITESDSIIVSETPGRGVLHTPNDTLDEVLKDSLIISETPGRDVLHTSNKILKDTLIISKKTNEFIPNSTKAVWYSVIFPGLGQIYNKKYWKLPIVYGGFMGIAYGLSFNQRYYTDYSLAYRDAMSDDPNLDSYKDFVPPSWTNIKEIQRVMKRKKDFYRRYRDLSIIGMIGMYAVCMIDAYVDAELYSFDISPDLSFRITPSIMNYTTNTLSGYQPFPDKTIVGIHCYFNF